MKEETMCRSIKLYEEEDSVESYEEYLRCILKDSCSLMVLCTGKYFLLLTLQTF